MRKTKKSWLSFMNYGKCWLNKNAKQDDKPGYVVDNHLSRHSVAAVLKRPT